MDSLISPLSLKISACLFLLLIFNELTDFHETWCESLCMPLEANITVKLEDSDAPLSSLVMEFQIGGGIDEPVA
jgi:hypothetical protein